jgi:Neuraminidase-like domain/Salmonella virulence plasmid 28.1kDa A protein
VRFDIAGKSLWYGTPDAPAPAATVVAGPELSAGGVTITIGVQPLNANNRVDLHYRVNGGAPARVPTVLYRTDVRAGAQYFSTRLQNLRVGDRVDYGAVCDCGNLQFPQPGPPHDFPSSFRVIGPAEAHPAIAAHAVALNHAAPSAVHAGAVAVHGPAARGNGATHPAAHPAINGGPPHMTGGSGHGSHAVEGTVSSPGRGPLAGVLVEIIDKNPGPHVSLATAITDHDGHYHANYSPPPHKAKPDICARVFARQTLLGVSAVHYNAGVHETLGVTIPPGTAGLPSEYEALTAATALFHKGRLADLRESDGRDDVTYLARKTGWDARAIAFAAVADRMAHAGGGRLPPPLYYALFRAGFGMDADAVYHPTTGAVAAAWRQAIAEDIIPKALAGSLDAATRTFQSLAALHALEARPAIGLSSLKELLQVTLGNDTPRQQAFAALHVGHRDDQSAFWTNVERSFGPELTKRLRLDGQLAHLTLNNAPLIAALHRAEARPPLATIDDLAWRGFHEVAKWLPLIGGAIPKEIAAGDISHRRAKYADYLTAQVRLTSPLAVAGDMVANGKLPLSPKASPADKGGVVAFFHEHHGRFSLGAEPVERYLAHNLSRPYPVTVVAEIKRLQRVYQITPNDRAFAALLHHGLDSAYAVTRYDPAGFARAFGHDLGGAAVANQVHAKARVVAAAALQIATSRLAARGAHAGASALAPAPDGKARDGPLVSSPTMEQLFGSMDFCDCPECRSVLSPAAYLVDLLNFIDYPPAGKKNPQSVLLERRPDLQFLPLTCENTNTALPYIDLVNETLEHLVTHRMSLADFRGHTTNGRVSSEELMANPQFVEEAAYVTLNKELFPPPLPFDRSLELVRRHFRAIGVPLHAAMAALHAPGKSGGTGGYGWQDILIERVRLSRAEHRLLTDGKLSLAQIYGFSSGEDGAERFRTRYAQANPETLPAAHHAPLEHAAPASSSPPQSLHPSQQVPLTAGIPGLLQHSPSAPLATVQALPVHATQGPVAHPPHSLPGGHGAAIVAELSNLQLYCRRVGLTYEELAAILRTRFINPDVGIAARVEALGVSLEIIQMLKAGEVRDPDFLELLPAGLDPAAYGAEPSAPKRDYRPIVAWLKDEANYRQIMDLVTITRPPDNDDVCSAAALRLCRANPDPTHRALRPVDFVRLLRFIRLWRKLGLSIEQTDAIVTALYPVATASDGSEEAELKRLDAGFVVLLSRLGFLLQIADQLSLSLDGGGLPALLACWAPIGTDGGHSPYAKMFLTEALLRQDPIFAEDPAGNVLQGAVKLFDHEPALRSALHLTGSEFARVAATLGFSAATALTLDNVSALYRRGWLARTLRLGVVELLDLIECTGIDPFAPLDLEAASAGGTRGSAVPSREPPMVRFISLVQRLRNVSLKPAQALYLLWSRDISGKSAPADTVVHGLARALRADAATVEAQFALVDDPDGSIAKNLTALAFGSETADFFFSLLDRTFAVSVPYGQPQPELPDAVSGAAQGRLAYDDLKKQLTYTGVLDDAALVAMTAATSGDDALQAAIAALANANRRAVDPFFASNPQLRQPYTGYVASTDPVPVKRKALLAAIVPDLKRRRMEEQALAAVTAAAGTDPSLAPILLRDAAVLASAADTALPAVVDFTAAAALVATLADGPVTGGWSGFVDAPKTGFYDIAVTADVGAKVTLEVGSVAVTMAQAGDAWRNETPVYFMAGSLTPVTLTITGATSGLPVRWTTTGIPWQPIPAASLYSVTLTDHLRTSYVRFLKAASLGSALSITANELAYLASTGDLQVGGRGWLQRLATSGAPDAATGSALTHVLDAVLDFARLKAALSPGDESLLAVLRDPDATLPGGGSALFALTHWDQASLAALLTHFFGDPSMDRLKYLENFRRVYDAYAIVSECGIGAAALIATTTNHPTAKDAADLRSALHARYADADWLTLIKPINDTMRALQRDALVTCILHHFKSRPATRGIDTPDRLFEYLLMDVEMAPCGQTSRIRLALSSIQLFIERALRSLEPEVDPSHISTEQWEWMKRYRIWQANREVFLWPENWLDPELRDDQSPFFKETMGELLQGDVDDDGAASALLGYLAKLHEVAKLEPCGLHYVSGDPHAASAVTHVIARSAGTKRKYYYRRQEHGSWTAWQDTKLQIEDNPVVPLIWNDRLILLWVQILKQAPPPGDGSSDGSSRSSHHLVVHHRDDPSSKKLTEVNAGELHEAVKSKAGDPVVTVQAVLCWSEYHNGKWLPANTSDTNAPALIDSFAADGPKAFDRSRLRLRTAVRRPDDALLVQLALDSALDVPTPGFLLYNTHSTPSAMTVTAEMLHRSMSQRLASYSSSALRIEYRGPTRFTRDIVHPRLPGRVVEAQPGLPDAFEAPFLYEDGRNAFLVTSEEHHRPLVHLHRFGLAHPSGVGHGASLHHFPSIAAPHQGAPVHRGASAASLVHFDGVLIGQEGRAVASHAGAAR